MFSGEIISTNRITIHANCENTRDYILLMKRIKKRVFKTGAYWIMPHWLYIRLLDYYNQLALDSLFGMQIYLEHGLSHFEVCFD